MAPGPTVLALGACLKVPVSDQALGRGPKGQVRSSLSLGPHSPMSYLHMETVLSARNHVSWSGSRQPPRMSDGTMNENEVAQEIGKRIRQWRLNTPPPKT